MKIFEHRIPHEHTQRHFFSILQLTDLIKHILSKLSERYAEHNIDDSLPNHDK